MQQFHLQNEESLNQQIRPEDARAVLQLHEDEALRNERVTEEEAQKIVRLWAEMQRQAPPGGPTVRDIAEGLEIPPEEAHRLLQQVRNQERVRTRAIERTKQRLIPTWVALTVAFLIALLLVGALTLVATYQQASPPATVAQPIEDSNLPAPSGGTTPSPPVGTPAPTIPPAR